MSNILEKHKSLYNLNYTQGKRQEDINFEFIKQVFNEPSLMKSAYRFSHFDYYSDRFLFELKTINNSVYKYRNVLLGTNKLICHTSIFIFKFITETDNEINYLQADNEAFENFNTGFVKGAGRMDYNEVYYIPVQYLTKINIDDKITLLYYDDKQDKILYKKAVEDDIKNSSVCK